MRRRFLSFLVLTAALLGCDGPTVNRPDAGPGIDGSSLPPPATPVLSGLDGLVPWPVATLRGSANDAYRILVEGGENPLVTTILPDGSFCIDVRMPTPGSYAFEVSSQGIDGQFSPMSVIADVVFDPATAPPGGATTCSGASPAGCGSAVEICDNGRDDDCNGLRDDADPACADCEDDLFEPNDDLSAPRLDEGRYDGLTMCPGNVDYYGVFARAGETIQARALFIHANGNIDLQLFGTDRMTRLASSMSMTDDEMIEFLAPTTGEYKLRISAPGAAVTTYTLTVNVLPAEG